MNLSIVVPLKNEAESLPELEAWIRRVCEAHQLSYEIIMVDDGSTDATWALLQDLHTRVPECTGKLRRPARRIQLRARGTSAGSR